ncbi:uncharacterized protein LOC142326955 [Lycorma delicatula]|uniref:uncharacterized protein LOC142326955 n=1 Tax=Lycorma delicatula TaxID=130591 RepID=UPI003F5111D1
MSALRIQQVFTMRYYSVQHDVDSSSTPRPRRPHCSTLNRVLQQVVNANSSQSFEVDDGNPTTDRCPICLTESVTVELSGCGHRYCEDCVRKLARYSRNCPVCRRDMLGYHRIREGDDDSN